MPLEDCLKAGDVSAREMEQIKGDGIGEQRIVFASQHTANVHGIQELLAMDLRLRVADTMIFQKEEC